MTTSIEPTSVIPEDRNPIAQRLAQLDALPRPAITEPCPEWCASGPHDAADLSMWVGGAGTFNHQQTFLQFITDDGTEEGELKDAVYVCQAETVKPDGTSERTPAVLYIDLADEITKPDVAASVGMGTVQAALLLKDINGGELILEGE